MKYAFRTLLCGLLLMGGCTMTPEVLSGHLHGALVWDGVVRIRGDLVLDRDATVTVRPGTHIVFYDPLPGDDDLSDHPNFPGSELIVHGRFVARGTVDAPILFSHESSSAGPGSWGGINLVSSPEAVFEYCSFTQADSAIHSRQSTVISRRNVFRENLVGLRFHSSDIRAEENFFHDNTVGIRFHFGRPVIRGNLFRNNVKAMFITSEPYDYVIENNDFGTSREYHIVLGESVVEDVRMSNNYWGMLSDNDLENLFFDGRRLTHLGKVMYQPRLAAPMPAGEPR